jgi:hypothetical protein
MHLLPCGNLLVVDQFPNHAPETVLRESSFHVFGRALNAAGFGQMAEQDRTINVSPLCFEKRHSAFELNGRVGANNQRSIV